MSVTTKTIKVKGLSLHTDHTSKHHSLVTPYGLYLQTSQSGHSIRIIPPNITVWSLYTDHTSKHNITVWSLYTDHTHTSKHGTHSARQGKSLNPKTTEWVCLCG